MHRILKGIIIVSVFMAGLAGPLAERAACQTRGLKKLAPGNWGGKHIGLQVTAEGATIEYDCAHGAIHGGIMLDRRGRFAVSGTHVEEHGGPVRESEQTNDYAVRVAGRVSGKRMRLTITNSETGRVLGVFTLINGQEPGLVKCR